MISGYDTPFVCATEFPSRVKDFIGIQVRHWPGLLLDDEPLDAATMAAWTLPETEGQTESEALTFCRDAAMDEFWEENGYALDAGGEGPFALFYRRFVSPLQADALSGVRQNLPEGQRPLDLEGAGLLLSEYYSVTLVTPEDPREDAFSRRVLHDLVNSLTADQASQ